MRDLGSADEPWRGIALRLLRRDSLSPGGRPSEQEATKKEGVPSNEIVEDMWIPADMSSRFGNISKITGESQQLAMV
jgi:hypothetical protein